MNDFVVAGVGRHQDIVRSKVAGVIGEQHEHGVIGGAILSDDLEEFVTGHVAQIFFGDDQVWPFAFKHRQGVQAARSVLRVQTRTGQLIAKLEGF